MGEDLRKLIRWLSSLHAPLGRWAPICGSGLFAAAGISGGGMLRAFAYCGAAAFAVLIAADIARSFIDRQLPPARQHPGVVLTLPVLGVRALLTVALGSIYSFLVFVGVGPWTPFFLWPVIFVICLYIAWRNLDLWYEQGVEFEEELAEAEHRQHSALPNVFGQHNH